MYRAFSLKACCPPTWPSDCADWPGYPGQSRDHRCAWTTNGEVHGQTVTHNNVKRCLHKLILISAAIEAAMLEESMTSHENTLYRTVTCIWNKYAVEVWRHFRHGHQHFLSNPWQQALAEANSDNRHLLKQILPHELAAAAIWRRTPDTSRNQPCSSHGQGVLEIAIAVEPARTDNSPRLYKVINNNILLAWFHCALILSPNMGCNVC